jgi:hypothetical protein
MKNKNTYASGEYVQFKNGTGGAVLAQLHGGDPAVFRVATGATVYGNSTSTTQELDIFIVEA